MPYRARVLRPLGWQPRKQLSTAKRGLGYQYRKLREQVLRDDPYCTIRRAGCTLLSTTADHILPLSRGGPNIRENLRGACESCNVGRSNAERAGRTQGGKNPPVLRNR
jgi:5-methylcytosine-specific restriction enzyme A